MLGNSEGLKEDGINNERKTHGVFGNSFNFSLILIWFGSIFTERKEIKKKIKRRKGREIKASEVIQT